ncbi:hypothetical protein [Haliangium sp.]|uniref:hypothetical protein n=1 Tax=Haliangium sp. TaxID=2663208 RepID=UPI003D0A5A9C
MDEADVHQAEAAAGDMEVAAGARIVVPVQWARRGRVPERDEDVPEPRPRGRIPRIARLLALAHHFQHLLDTRVVPSQTELARLAKISTARCTQIMNLLVLAPDIQEEILFLAPVCKGRAAITEKKLKPVLATLVWAEQRRRWAEVKRQRL